MFLKKFSFISFILKILVTLYGDRYALLNSSSTVSMNNGNINNSTMYLDADNKSISTILHNTSTHTITGSSMNGKTTANNSFFVPHLKSKNSSDYLGILEWKVEDEQKIVTKLIEGKLILIVLFMNKSDFIKF
jgi:hypothetical protein